MLEQLAVGKSSKEHLHLSHTSVFEHLEILALRSAHRVDQSLCSLLRRHPSVSVSKQSDEIRTVLADGIHADMQDFRFPQILVILGGIYSPSEVSYINGNSIRLKFISQLWDYILLDIVSLRMHIAERTAEEDIDMSMLHRLSDSFVLREYTKNGIEIDKFPAVFEN